MKRMCSIGIANTWLVIPFFTWPIQDGEVPPVHLCSDLFTFSANSLFWPAFQLWSVQRRCHVFSPVRPDLGKRPTLGPTGQTVWEQGLADSSLHPLIKSD